MYEQFCVALSWWSHWCKCTSTSRQQRDVEVKMVAVVKCESRTVIVSRYHRKLCVYRNDISIVACCCDGPSWSPAGPCRCNGEITRVCIYRVNARSRLTRGVKVLLDTWCAVSIPKAHISVGHTGTISNGNIGPRGDINIVHDFFCLWVIGDLDNWTGAVGSAIQDTSRVRRLLKHHLSLAHGESVVWSWSFKPSHGFC